MTYHALMTTKEDDNDNFPAPSAFTLHRQASCTRALSFWSCARRSARKNFSTPWRLSRLKRT